MPHKLPKLAGIFGALALFLLLLSLSLSVSYPAHEQYINLIAQQLENNASINQSVLRSRYNLLTSYDPLVQATHNQVTIQQKLSAVPNYINGRGKRKLRKQFDINLQLFKQQEDIVEQFKSKNAVLKNSLTYLPQLVRELKQKGLTDDGSVLSNVLDNVLLYTLSTDNSLLPNIRNGMKQLAQQQDPQRSLIHLAISHAEIILETKPDVEQLTQKILTLPIAEQLHHLNSTYSQLYREAQDSASLFRQLAYAWLLVMGAGLAYWIVQKQLEAKQLTSQILESIQDAFVAVDRSWRITYVNSQTVEALQLGPKSLIHQPLWTIFPEELGADRIDTYHQAASEHRLQSFEVKLASANCWYEVRAYPGKEGLSIFLRDITARTQAEQRLRQAHDDLEIRVEARTHDLKLINQELQAEVVERTNVQEEILFLQQVTQKISEAKDLGAALALALQAICEKTGWDFSESWVPNRSGDYLECAAIWHRGQVVLNKRLDPEPFKTATRAPHVGLPGRVWQNQEPEWIDDIADRSEPIESRLNLSQSQVTMGFGIPIIDNQQVITVLTFFMTRPKGDRMRQIKLVSMVALQLGSLIRRKKAEGALRSSLATNTARTGCSAFASMARWLTRRLPNTAFCLLRQKTFWGKI
jgi:PAS domain S-box-containing protein